jgi:hypothetical protein
MNQVMLTALVSLGTAVIGAVGGYITARQTGKNALNSQRRQSQTEIYEDLVAWAQEYLEELSNYINGGRGPDNATPRPAYYPQYGKLISRASRKVLDLYERIVEAGYDACTYAERQRKIWGDGKYEDWMIKGTDYYTSNHPHPPHGIVEELETRIRVELGVQSRQPRFTTLLPDLWRHAAWRSRMLLRVIIAGTRFDVGFNVEKYRQMPPRPGAGRLERALRRRRNRAFNRKKKA